MVSSPRPALWTHESSCIIPYRLVYSNVCNFKSSSYIRYKKKIIEFEIKAFINCKKTYVKFEFLHKTLFKVEINFAFLVFKAANLSITRAYIKVDVVHQITQRQLIILQDQKALTVQWKIANNSM
jgi:hypothetical protein